MQRESIDDDLRNRLWNCLDAYFWSDGKGRHHSDVPDLAVLCWAIWNNYFKLPIDTMENWFPSNFVTIRRYYFECAWDQVYDFIEFVANAAKSGTEGFQKACNSVLAGEVSAYRFIGGRIVEITSTAEIEAIEDATQASSRLPNVQLHLKTALGMLADRASPDYRNSIKEAVSAVEALCNLIVGSKTTTLGHAIRKLETAGVDTHPALEDALAKMYGYSSDADGIRHALMDESNLDFEDAKFMLVSCSAFVNYLLAKAGKAGIIL
jgi:hypothetical protein